MNPTAGRNRFATGTWLFLRMLGLVHLVAFVSIWVQLEGLIGPNGILPAGPFLMAVREHLGTAAYWQLPTLSWGLGPGAGLHILCGLGVVAALLLVAGIMPGPSLIVLWLGYLSLCGVGQVFFNFQWDALLLETTFLALWVTPWGLRPGWKRPDPPPLARWLLVWLVFRLMFLSGLVKLTSGDLTWADLTALTFHYETQPLPTPLGWYAHQLPAWLQRASCGLMFVIELAGPFLFFAPWRPFRHAAVLATMGLMLLIALTGNYTFFNLLTAVLCLPLLDDALWNRLGLRPAPTLAPPRHVPFPVLAVLAGVIGVFTTIQAVPALFRSWSPPAVFRSWSQAVAPFRSFNNYGLFAVMTTTRPEIVIEGSDDGRTWQAYEFRHKPGNLSRRPTWVAPHQPRLDWQMWFAALGRIEQNHWMLALCEHLLRGTPEVTGLLATNPFPDAPPRHLRAVRYEYKFTDPGERSRTGRWWRQTPVEYYLPPATLP